MCTLVIVFLLAMTCVCVYVASVYQSMATQIAHHLPTPGVEPRTSGIVARTLTPRPPYLPSANPDGNRPASALAVASPRGTHPDWLQQSGGGGKRAPSVPEASVHPPPKRSVPEGSLRLRARPLYEGEACPKRAWSGSGAATQTKRARSTTNT